MNGMEVREIAGADWERPLAFPWSKKGSHKRVLGRGYHDLA